MKASVEKLRWVLAAGAVLMLLVLAGFLGYGRYKQAKKWAATLKRLNLHGPHETRGFTYSSSPKDRTSYKVHAERVVEHGDGTWSMYDVNVTLYSKTSPDVDHIRASDIEYDQNSGVAKAIGEVNMDFEAPGALKGARTAPKDNGAREGAANVIHVKTSGLVYSKKQDLASTDQMAEFRYAGLQCTSHGAEFDSGHSQLRLLADVVMTGDVKNQPLTIHAVRAELDRNQNTVTMERPVGQTRGRTMAAAHAVLHLRKDGSLERADGDGGVTMDEGTRHISAASYTGTFGTTSLPVTAKLLGGVTMMDSDAHRPMHGKAAMVDASFTDKGDAKEVIASGGAQMFETVKTAGQPDMPREVRGDRITTEYAPLAGGAAHKPKTAVHEILVSGSAFASGVSPADKKGGLKTTQLAADELRAEMVTLPTGALQIQQLTGNGHTRIVQMAPQNAQQVSNGDELTAKFTAGRDGELQVASATQDGHVALHSVPALKPGASAQDPADATGVHASYDGSSATFTLTGNVQFQQGLFDLTAAKIAVNQLTGDADASGGLIALMRPDPKAANATGVNKASGTPQQPTHITADHGTLLHAAQLAQFFGTTGHPARLWQGASEVQAASLLLDQKKKSIAARPESGGKIHAVFANAAGQTGTAHPGAAKTNVAENVVRVVSSTMDYDDVHREGTFGGGVRMEGTATQAQSQRAVVLLEPAQAAPPAAAKAPVFGGQVRRVVLMDNVHLSQPGRTGTGEMLVYNAADANYTLTGTPERLPHVVDSKQGNITGTTLVFHDEGTGDASDSTIIVNGSETSGKQGRVRAEVEVKGK